MKTENSQAILALFLPFLQAERRLREWTVSRQENALDTNHMGPFALTENRKGARVLAALDQQACALGLTAGMKLADARARVPELQSFDHDPRGDEQLLARLGGYCERYTPVVALHPPQSLVLNISGCVHLFGSEAALVEDMEARFDRAGFSVQWALAGSFDAALALARHGLKQGAEAQLPVAALAMDDRTHHALERAGLYHIGDLISRPRGPLAARFGPELVLKLERLLGQDDRPVNPVRRQAAIMTEQRFADPIGHFDSALNCLQELFVQAANMLEERGQGARQIRAEFFRCDGQVVRLDMETGAATRDVKLFRRLLRERIDILNDPLDPGFGYDLLRLHILRAEALDLKQVDIGGGKDKEADQAALIGQISIRLGRDAVQRFMPADSHNPEHGLAHRPALDGPPLPQSPIEWDRPKPGEPPSRPLFMFDPPQPVEVLAEVPDGPPRRFGWRRNIYQIVRAEGPERIAADWWRLRHGHVPGHAGLTRDYYRVEDSEGRRYWLFRHGLYGQEKAQPAWYIHGSFA